MPCYIKSLLSVLVVALALGIIFAMFLPQWLISLILAVVVIIVGIALYKC